MANFDPHEVLGLTTDATVKEVKKAYKKLSLEWHPDKNPDPNAKKVFFRLTKAKEILTDPKKYDNFIKTGDPDGKGTFKMSVALPSFLFDERYSLYILIAFAFFLLVLFPLFVYYCMKSDKPTHDPSSGLSLQNMNWMLPYWGKQLRASNCAAFMSRTLEIRDFDRVTNSEEQEELADLVDLMPKQVSSGRMKIICWKNFVVIQSHQMRIELSS